MAKKRKGERPDGLIQVSLQIGYKPDGRPDRNIFMVTHVPKRSVSATNIKPALLLASSWIKI